MRFYSGDAHSYTSVVGNYAMTLSFEERCDGTCLSFERSDLLGVVAQLPTTLSYLECHSDKQGRERSPMPERRCKAQVTLQML